MNPEQRALALTVDGPFYRRFIRLVLVLALLGFLTALDRPATPGIHERRVLATAHNMLRAGAPWHATVEVGVSDVVARDGGLVLSNTPSTATISVNPWLVPVMNETVRLQKPPLPYWCTAICGFAVDNLTVAGRLPPAIMGIIGAFLMHRLGRRIIGRFGGACAAGAWVSSFFVVSEFRKAMADPYLAFAVLLFVASWVELSANPRNRSLWYGGLLLALSLGAMAKGPIMLLHVMIAIGSLLLARRRRPRLPWWFWPMALAAFAVPLWWWSHTAASVIPGAWELWRSQSIGLITEASRKARAWWFYIPQIPLICFPWILPFFSALWVNIAHPRRHRLFAASWIVLTIFVFSLAAMKKNAYLLPCAPAVCLVIGEGLRQVRARTRSAQGVVLLERFVGGITGVALNATLVIRTTAFAQRGEWTWLQTSWLSCAVIALLVSAWLLLQRDRRLGVELSKITVGFSLLVLVYSVSKDAFGG